MTSKKIKRCLRRPGSKAPSCRKDEDQFKYYIAEDDLNTSKACSPEKAYADFRDSTGQDPLRILGVLKDDGKGCISAFVLEEFDPDSLE